MSRLVSFPFEIYFAKVEQGSQNYLGQKHQELLFRHLSCICIRHNVYSEVLKFKLRKKEIGLKALLVPPPSRSMHFLALKRRLCCREVCDVMSELHLAHSKGLVLLPTQNIFIWPFILPHTHTNPSLHTLLFSSFVFHFRCAQSEIM